MKDTVLEDTFLPGDEQPEIGDLVDLECQLCENSTQHNCSICDQKICNFCSQQDPNSSNEMKRIHMARLVHCILAKNVATKEKMLQN